MFISLCLALSTIVPLPVSWVADSTFNEWCTSQGLTPAQVLQEFTAIDHIMAAEQRYWASHDSTYLTCLPWQNFGKTVAEFNAAVGGQVPLTPLSGDTASRIIVAVVNPFDAEDTCTILHATLYSPRSPYNLPAVSRELCPESGQSEYRFTTEYGSLVIDGGTSRVTLYDTRTDPTKRIVLYQPAVDDRSGTAPVDSSSPPRDSTCLPSSTVVNEPW
ncbi:MAG: hypothetical protein V1916_01180 [Patescibacteria group bacterium]